MDYFISVAGRSQFDLTPKFAASVVCGVRLDDLPKDVHCFWSAANLNAASYSMTVHCRTPQRSWEQGLERGMHPDSQPQVSVMPPPFDPMDPDRFPAQGPASAGGRGDPAQDHPMACR